MLLKPRKEDLKAIGFHIGRLIVALGLTMIIPLIIAILFKEHNRAIDFTIAIFSSISLGLFLQIISSTEKDLNWMSGLVVVATSWLVIMLIGAIPLYLSGHFASYLDACFDAMSGFATTGLSLIQNSDHISNSVNMWRHLMMFLGGQGIVVIGLTFLIKGTAGAYRLYVGEAREERVLPNVISTARFIWSISLIYLIVGSSALALTCFFGGMPIIRSALHGVWLFMAAFDTGGFTPQSQSILYYHNFPLELVTIVLMILGALNFSIHYLIWSGKFKEIFKNIETRTLTMSVIILGIFLTIGLVKFAAYPSTFSMLRKGLFQLISAHTGTGYMTIYATQFVNEWKTLAMFIIALAMGFGASMSSTAGGIKAFRIGILIKTLLQDVKKFMKPGTAVLAEHFHHIKDMVLEEKVIRNALVIMLAYIATYLIGTGIGIFYGYPLYQALFESISATANVGLSCGITSPSMPTGLKITYILQMWLGRLEFLSVLALIGFILANFIGVKGRESRE